MNLLIKSFLTMIIVGLVIFLFIRTTDLDHGLINEAITNEEDNESGKVDSDQEKIFIIDGYKAIQLDEEVIASSGLEFKKLESVTLKPEFVAYAEVVNIEPLLLLKSEHQSILSDRDVLRNELNSHNKILSRAEALHEARSLSTRELEQIRADRDLIASKLNAINSRLESFSYDLKSTWGDVLAGMVSGFENKSVFDDIASNKKALILLSLKKNQTLKNEHQSVVVSNVIDRDTALAVEYLDKARQVNNPLLGESYYYLLDSGKTRAGMRLFAWIVESAEAITGLFMPENAIVWYANNPWFFTKHGDDFFIRKPLGNARKISGGWLLEDKSLVNDELVVTRGGQTLLSEEFKWAIPDEEDD